MADYVRRQIAPLLPGLSGDYLELIIGELEIATETRHVDDDALEAVTEILDAAGYSDSAAKCAVIMGALGLTGATRSSSSAISAADLTEADTSAAAAAAEAVAAAEEQEGPVSAQPLPCCETCSSATAALLLVTLLLLLPVAAARSSAPQKGAN